jgi:ATP-binding cassette subfamily F protein uup
VVSHDRYLTERVCDRVVGLFGDGRITDLPGGIEEYLRRRARQSAAPSISGASAPGNGDARGEIDRRAARKEAARIERRLEKIDAQEKKLHEKLAEAATEPGRLQELDGELRALVGEREQLEEAWLEANVD